MHVYELEHIDTPVKELGKTCICKHVPRDLPMTELRNRLCADLYINTYLWQCLEIHMCVNVAYKILSVMELGRTCMYLPIMEVRNKFLCLCTCWCICDRSRKHMLWTHKQRLAPGKARKPCICKLAPVGIPVTELEYSCLWTWAYTPMAWLRNIYVGEPTHVQPQHS